MDELSQAIASDVERADHEAGHYLLCHVLKFPHTPLFITIEMGLTEDGSGGTGGGVASDFFDGLDPEQWGTYSVAGAMAQSYGIFLRGGEDAVAAASLGHAGSELEKDRIFLRGGESAVNAAAERIGFGMMGDLKQFYQKLGEGADYSPFLKKADEIVRDNWDLVNALSVELCHHRTLYQDEPRLIIEATRQGHVDFLEHLKVYREFRHEIDIRGPEWKLMREQYPGLKMYEAFKTFYLRERWRFEDQDVDQDEDQDVEDICDSESEDDGSRKPEHAVPDPISLAKELVTGLFDRTSRKIKAKARSLLPW